MGYLDYLVDQVIARAVDEISSTGHIGQIVTLALYFDHEGAVISVCADTLQNSLAKQKAFRDRSHVHLTEAIRNGDLLKAAKYNHNVSRNLNLGDFALIGLAEHALDPDEGAGEMPQNFFVALAQGLHRNTAICLSVCDPNESAVFTCSTVSDEVGLAWTPPCADQ